VALASVAELVRVTGADDPFAGQGGDDVDCPASSALVADFGGEDAYDVSTDGCPRITVAAPALVAGEVGDRLKIRAWHDALFAFGAQGATAVMALAIGGHEVWRVEIPIPQEVGGAELTDLALPVAWQPGDPVAWHVHNHGKNSYHLLELAVRPLVPEVVDPAE
jgi:hypothetical protein